jgi:hypothetical protein
VQSLSRCRKTVGEQWSEFDLLASSRSPAPSSVCRTHGARPYWRYRSFSGLEERAEFFNGKLDVLHEQQQIGRLSASPQPSLQQAGMLRQAMGTVLSPLQQCKEVLFAVVFLNRRVSHL